MKSKQKVKIRRNEVKNKGERANRKITAIESKLKKGILRYRTEDETHSTGILWPHITNAIELPLLTDFIIYLLGENA